MSGDDGRCPNCGSEDYGKPGGPGSYDPAVCLSCGYDTHNGVTGVCPGGKHPNDGKQICCDECWKRVPRDVGDFPKWRSRLRSSRQIRAWSTIERIIDAVRAWLRDHPRETSNP